MVLSPFVKGLRRRPRCSDKGRRSDPCRRDGRRPRGKKKRGPMSSEIKEHRLRGLELESALCDGDSQVCRLRNVELDLSSQLAGRNEDLDLGGTRLDFGAAALGPTDREVGGDVRFPQDFLTRDAEDHLVVREAGL